jgi:hypothetical protein
VQPHAPQAPRAGREQRLNLVVAGIGLEHTLVPPTRRRGVTLPSGDVAEMTQAIRFSGSSDSAVSNTPRASSRRPLSNRRLPVDDVPAHVTGLLRQELLADQNRLFEVSTLSEFIGQGSEVAAGILVELLFELVDAVGAGHQSLGGGAQAAVGEAE